MMSSLCVMWCMALKVKLISTITANVYMLLINRDQDNNIMNNKGIRLFVSPV